MSNQKEYYLVYITKCNTNNKEYTGFHKTKNINDNYLGSGVALNAAFIKYGKENFTRKIIFNAVSQDIGYWIERMLVDEEYVADRNNYNITTGGKGGGVKGIVTVKDKNNNTFTINNKDPRIISGELVYQHTGKVVVKDKQGHISQVSVNDKRYISGELITIHNIIVNIYDKNNNLKFECFGNFSEVCKNNNLPVSALKNSYKNNGEGIYIKRGHGIIKKYIDHPLEGWFALKIT